MARYYEEPDQWGPERTCDRCEEGSRKTVVSGVQAVMTPERPATAPFQQVGAHRVRTVEICILKQLGDRQGRAETSLIDHEEAYRVAMSFRRNSKRPC